MRKALLSWRDAKRRWRQHLDRRREFYFVRRLHGELLEDRHLLAVITVDTLTDEADGSISDGDISLRDAIAIAAAGDTIDFDVALDGGTILLALGELPITRAMTIDASSLSSGFTIDASGNDPTPDQNNGDGSRIFNINDLDRATDSEVTLSGLTLTGGDLDAAVRTFEAIQVTDCSITDNSGRGIYGSFSSISPTTITVTSSTISNNSGSGISGEFAIVTVTSSTISDNSGYGILGGSVTVTSSTISDNSAAGIAGGSMTVTSSTITGNSGGRFGGGISAELSVSINSSTISGNSAGYFGGGIFCGLYCHLSVTSSTISGNSAGKDGGGIFGHDKHATEVTDSFILDNTAGGNGGGISSETITITSSTVSGNTAGGNGGGIYAEVFVEGYYYGSVTVQSSTITGNMAGGRGGGIHGLRGVEITSSTVSANTAIDGGGNHGSSVEIRSSTISGNTAVDSGGIEGRLVNVEYGTITGNSADANGGGIRADTVRMNHSLVAANSDNGQGPDVNADALTSAYSLIGDNTGSGLSEAPVGMPDENGNLVGDPNGMGIIDPFLSPLGNFGGSTQTHALLPGSPAINSGDHDFAAPPDHDQRGPPFLRVSGDRIDIGAFESQIAPVDFNNDEQLDCADVDALVAAIVDGDNLPEFDLTGDALVDQADLDVWLTLAGLENLPSHEAYLLGDANLDGKIDALDLNEIGLNWRQDVMGWCSGDFTADGMVDANDLNALGLNWQQNVSGDEGAAAGARVPRAPLANRVVAAISAAPEDSPIFIAGSEPNLKLSPDVRNVELGTEYVLAGRFAKRYVQSKLRSSSTRINSRAHDVIQTQVIGKDELVDLVLGRW